MGTTRLSQVHIAPGPSAQIRTLPEKGSGSRVARRRLLSRGIVRAWGLLCPRITGVHDAIGNLSPDGSRERYASRSRNTDRADHGVQ